MGLHGVVGVVILMMVGAAPLNGVAQEAHGAHGAAEWLYVTNQDDASVSIIDLATLAVVTTVDLEQLGFTANAKPHDAAVEPDGSFWYVSLIGDNRIVKLDRANRVVGVAEFETPGMFARHPDGRRLIVGRSMTAPNPPMSIAVVDRMTMALEPLDVFHPRPHGLVVDPTGRYAITASLAANQIMVVDLATDEVTFTEVPGAVHVLAHMMLSPDGRRLAISGERSNQMLLFDASRLPALRLLSTVEVPAAPWHPVFTPDGRFVYVGNQRAHSVTVLDATSWTVVTVIRHEALAYPHGSVVSPDGRYVFVSNRNLNGTWNPRGVASPPGNVVVINTATNAVERVIEVERGPTGMGMSRGHH